jgi:hypothetical protein
LAVLPEAAIEGTFRLRYRSKAGEFELPPLADRPPGPQDLGNKVFSYPIDVKAIPASDRIPASRLRIPVSPEDGFAVRSSGFGENADAVVLEMIGRDQWRAGEKGQWIVANANLNREIWHGAAVIASQDERVLGMLIVVDDLPTIVPIPFSPSADRKQTVR